MWDDLKSSDENCVLILRHLAAKGVAGPNEPIQWKFPTGSWNHKSASRILGTLKSKPTRSV